MSIRHIFSTSTDAAWERLAQADPYHAVLTSHTDRDEFFRSGEHHVADLLAWIRRLVAPGFAHDGYSISAAEWVVP
jgi:hypothetical protein